MKWKSLALAGGIFAFALGSAPALGAGQTEDFATGSARNAYPTPAGPGYSVLSVTARSGLSGQNPQGYVTAQGTTGAPMGEFAVGGEVTCLRVSGNKAAIKYRFDRASGSAAEFQGGGVEVFVEDNGHSVNGRPVDAAAFDPPQTAATFNATASQCDDPNLAAYNTVESGEYTVGQRTVGSGRGHHRRDHDGDWAHAPDGD